MDALLTRFEGAANEAMSLALNWPCLDASLDRLSISQNSTATLVSRSKALAPEKPGCCRQPAPTASRQPVSWGGNLSRIPLVAGSAATTTLLSFALVLLGGGLVVPQSLQISKNASLGHLALEATQRRFNPFVFADSDLGHEMLLERRKHGNLASPPTALLRAWEEPLAGGLSQPGPSGVGSEPRRWGRSRTRTPPRAQRRQQDLRPRSPGLGPKPGPGLAWCLR